MIDIHTKLHTMFGISTVVHTDNKSRRQWHIWQNTNHNTTLFKTQRKMLIHQCTCHFSSYPVWSFIELCLQYVIFSLPPMKFYRTIWLCTCHFLPSPYEVLLNRLCTGMLECFCFYTIKTLLKQLINLKETLPSHFTLFANIRDSTA